MKRLLFIALAFVYSTAPTLVLAKPKQPKAPKHIVLIIGDGTGLAQWSAYNAKRTQGINSMDSAASVFRDFPIFGMSFTSSANKFITDSGAGGTALSTGQKSNNYMVGMAADSSKPLSLSEIAHLRGKSTGIAVTCELTHATPGAFFAHQTSRKMMKEIGDDFLNGMKYNPFGVLQYGEQSGGINMMKTQDGSIDVAIGGGKMYFDTQALVQRGYSVGCGYGSMKQLQNQNRRVIFYNDSAYPPKAHEGRNSQGPFLADASESILKTMFENPLGSFTMIEGSQVDWAGHENDSAYLLAELADLDVTIQRVLAMAKDNKETLIVITADHETGGLSLVGWDKKAKQPAMHFSTHEHTGIPVPVFAYGPGAEAFGGSYQNTQVFYKIKALLEQPDKKK